MRRAKFCRCDLLAFAIQAGIPKTTCCPFFRGIGDSRLRRSSSEWNLWAGNSAKEHEKKGMRKHKLKSIALACNKKWTKKTLVSFPSLEVQVSIVLKMVGTLQAHQTCFITRCIGVKMLNLGGYVVPQIYTNFETSILCMRR